MEYSINTFYKNHSHIYKILLFIATTFLIVFMFPKSGRFKYNFEKGKPWQTENLYAPFDFAIQKKPADLAKEKELLKQQSSAYFNRDKTVKNDVIKNFNSVFDKTFNDTLQFKTELKNQALSIISKFYEYGIINENLKFSNNKKIVILEDNQEVEATEFKNLYNQTEVKSTIENTLTNVFSNSSKNALIAVFFNVIKPNLTYDKTLTENVLNESLQTVSINRGVVEKETLIISKGEIVNDNKFQILNSLSKEYESKDWTKSNYYWIVFAYTLLVALALLMLLLFIRKYRLDVYNNNTKVTFIFFNVLVVVLLTTLIINYKSEYVYIVPIAILPLVLKAFFDARLGLFTHVITVLLLGSIVPNSYEYMFLQIIAGIVTILTVSELYKRANLFISVGQITLIYIIAYFAFFVIHEASIENIHKQTFVLFILCGLATLFVQPLIYIYEKLFGLVSDVSLLELSDTNSRLLKELSNKAPGTFHHSLNVANLAEASANEINANAMLVRVGALYHDIGKMKNPTFFTENQSSGINSHDELSPKESAQIIINHVINGIEIAKKNNLPDRVIDFIRTHHGTSQVYYFYMKEKANNEDVNIEDFTYPGPKPFSKETAILMMCDSVEAASKSLKEPTSSKIDNFVENIINKQKDEGQFLNADITFKEIEAIKKVLKRKLANIYHLRIEYPE
ncbi:HD superfamily hydrolase domain-containing membrane protein [Mesoflavibacter sp. HG96]|uniref:HD family phosphohydrolase n=1 Tax=Mesoflavibacter TaxID=444051 RepID=UPI000D103B38|nr:MULTISPECIES: HDIG domain-containing metalloprotein [Mesoflavibacter]QIJ90171.1 HD superfamily hydrolase domain-containing membrane protein [Mesoflavibacter sp. HG96]QIJ92899.1 HD superfamily hydrolase domain-containing membrane protein [Mesoflavibacter sp. HG37]